MNFTKSFKWNIFLTIIGLTSLPMTSLSMTKMQTKPMLKPKSNTGDWAFRPKAQVFIHSLHALPKRTAKTIVEVPYNPDDNTFNSTDLFQAISDIGGMPIDKIWIKNNDNSRRIELDQTLPVEKIIPDWPQYLVMWKIR